MNREILFRGKSIAISEWVYGYYLVAAGMPFISTFGEKEPIAVIPETVGQFTGLTDKNGNKIFDGDILKAGDKFIYEVVFDQHTCSFMLEDKYGRNSLTEPKGRHYEVIGNIHDKEVTK